MPEVEHRRVGEAEQAELGRVVGGAPAECVDRGERGDVDDESASSLLHERRGVMDRVERAEEVGLENVAEARGRHFVHAREPSDPSVVDQDIETAELLPDPLDQGLLVPFSPGVRGKTPDVPARRGELLDRPADGVFGPAGDRDAEPFSRQSGRDRSFDLFRRWRRRQPRPSTRRIQSNRRRNKSDSREGFRERDGDAQ